MSLKTMEHVEKGNKTVSIVVPAYNIEAYIGRCMDSILAQSYPALEILAVDDGSTDRTGEILDAYASRDARIRVFHRENGGLSEARNTALTEASGNYIGFVDGDDYITADMFSELVKACEEQQAQIACCAYRQIGDEAVNPPATGQVYALTREEALHTFVCDDKPYHIYYSVWSKLFRRELLEGLSFPAGRNSEDILFSTKALLRAERVAFVDRPLYCYIVSRPDSIMNQNLHNRRFRDEIPFMKEQIVCFAEADMPVLSEKAYYHFCRRMLFYYIDFQKRGMHRSASELHRLLKSDGAKIRQIYRRNFVKRGDRVRMRLFLSAPYLYYFVVLLYDRLIIPLRLQIAGTR